MGVQSTAMYLMSSGGLYDKADYAIFADPQAESKATYKMLDWLLNWQKENDGIPIIINRDHNILEDTLNGVNALGRKFVTIPAFSENGGMVMRQCTGEYKVRPVLKEIRKLYGLKKNQHLPPTELWLGISIDESSRMKDNVIKAITNKYPLIDLMMSRSMCINFFKNNNIPVPSKSSCVFCPYHSDSFWKDIKNDNSAWQTILDVDNKIRNNTKRGEKDKLYLHRSLKPMSEAYFQENQLDLFENECEGHCGL